MRGLIIAGALVLGPVVVVACVDGLATAPVVDEESNVAFSVNGGRKHFHRCPPPFATVFDDDELWDESVDRNNNSRICSNGHQLIDDSSRGRKRAIKK